LRRLEDTNTHLCPQHDIAGWHRHFLTDDRKGGGHHLLGCSGAGLEAKMEDLDNLRLAIPETTQFLHADLAQDPSQALDKAERAH
jgi:acetolactate decarboxylase